LTAAVELPAARYPKPEQATQFYQQVVERVQALPGVVNASAIMPLPVSNSIFRTSLDFEAREYPQGEKPRTMFRSVSLNYFDTMKIELLNGRDFTKHDTASTQTVAIVNEAFVRAYFPDENPIGKRVKPGVSLTNETPWREIVGVVRNVKHRSQKHDYDPELYVPHAQLPMWGMALVVRTEGDPKAVARALQAEATSIDKDIPVYRLKTMDQYLGTAMAKPRFNALLLGMFGVLALLLTAIGLYGVIAYSVAQRTQEIGIRVALGAQSTDVMKMVVRQGMVLTLAGLAVGIASAFYLTRLLSAMLYGISATDKGTFVSTALILLGVALAASFIPARRAARVDPIIALRDE
jgi:putative ABC transport system permease protein